MAAAKAWLAAKENHGRSAAPTPKRANEQLLSGLRPGKPGGSPDANLLSALGCALQDSNRAAAVAAETAALCAREALLDADGAAAKLTAEQCDCAIDRDLLTRAEREGADAAPPRRWRLRAEVMRELVRLGAPAEARDACESDALQDLMGRIEAKKATRDELERALKTHRKTADLAALGLAAPPTSEGELRKAYHKMARAHHPDKGGDPAKFRRLKDAYTRATKQFKRAHPAKEERAEKPEEEAEKPEAEKPEAEKPEEEDEAREGEAMAKEDKDERVREDDDVEEGKATDSDAEDATPPAVAESDGLVVLVSAVNRLLASARDAVNASAYAAGARQPVLDASEAVNEAIEAARDAAGADGDAMAAVGAILSARAGDDLVRYRVSIAAIDLKSACDRAARATHRCAQAATGVELNRWNAPSGKNFSLSAATEAAAKLTKAHEDLARRAAAPPRDDDDDEEEEDKDDDGDDEKPAPAPEAPRADEDTEAKLRRLTREAEVLHARLSRSCAALRAELLPRCAPSADQARALRALCAAALDRTIDDAATRYASARDAKRALEAASAWLLADAPEAEATAEALDARVFLVCAVHDGAACRSLCAALAPRLAAAVRGAPGGDELAKRTCGAILGRIAVLAGRFEVV
ncbi:hypothetical protein JL722_7066 [Aureococcus anophagefferens]|nr:hypothetical protein JL722_7066 [Aureococcus anophagefferens]